MNGNKKNILVITQWSFKDPLIQAYTLPYLFIIADQLAPGSKIHLVSFEQKVYKMDTDEIKSVKYSLKEKGIYLIDYNYSSFGIIGLIRMFFNFIHLFSIIIFKQISYIHAWCTPAGALGYILSRVTGRPLIIDSYEPHAEAMVENKTWKADGLKYKILFYFEKKLSRHAEIIISATKGMYDYAKVKYNVIINNFYVKPACVDLINFTVSKRKNQALLKELNLENKVVCVYAGKFGGIYLTEEVFDFFRVAEQKWGDRFRALLLTSYNEKELYEWAVKSQFSPDKMIVRFIPHNKIPDYLGLGDFGITPVKSIPTKKYCTPIKDGEYWAMGLPVVITKNISDDSDIISDNNAGAVIEELSLHGYKNAVEKIYNILKEPEKTLRSRIEMLAKQYRGFNIAEDIYRKIYK